MTQCIESILEQPITKEIIIIDDGSTDDSLTVALKYAKKHSNIYIIHTEKRGAGAARNIGLKLAKGEYISFIDADDYLIGNLAQILEEGKRHNADLIRFRAILFYPNATSQYREYPDILEKHQVITGHNMLEKMYESNHWVPGVCWTLIKRSYLEQYQITFKEGVIAEDQLFYIQLLTSSSNCTLINLPYVCYMYRQNNSLSVSKRRDLNYVLDHLKMISYIRQYLLSQSESIQPYILYVTKKILWTAIQIIETWDMQQRQQFSYFFQDDWEKILKQDYPKHWENIKQLYHITE